MRVPGLLNKSLTMRTFALIALAFGLVSGARYTVSVVSQPSDPVVSWLSTQGNSPWPQNFNPSYVTPSSGTSGVGGLLIRAQNCTPTPFVPGKCIGCNVDGDWPISPWFPGSVLTFAAERPDGSYATPYPVFAPNASAPQDETYGTEDPRIAYDASTGLYHLFYTCYGKPGPFLCHASTADPTAPLGKGQWTRHGAVFPKQPGSKSGALLIRDAPPHYLIWGAGTIALATSTDLLSFTTINASFITARKDGFDNNLVEAGPPPLKLSTGDYLFLHNSDNATSSGGGDFWAYNPGWVILDGTNPANILARSQVPLLSPIHGWEQGTAPYMCNVHNVTFLEAARPVPGMQDAFDVWFGGSDAVIGTARIQVNVQQE